MIRSLESHTYHAISNPIYTSISPSYGIRSIYMTIQQRCAGAATTQTPPEGYPKKICIFPAVPLSDGPQPCHRYVICWRNRMRDVARGRMSFGCHMWNLDLRSNARSIL